MRPHTKHNNRKQTNKRGKCARSVKKQEIKKGRVVFHEVVVPLKPE